MIISGIQHDFMNYLNHLKLDFKNFQESIIT